MAAEIIVVADILISCRCHAHIPTPQGWQWTHHHSSARTLLHCLCDKLGPLNKPRTPSCCPCAHDRTLQHAVALVPTCFVDGAEAETFAMECRGRFECCGDGGSDGAVVTKHTGVCNMSGMVKIQAMSINAVLSVLWLRTIGMQTKVWRVIQLYACYVLHLISRSPRGCCCQEMSGPFHGSSPTPQHISAICLYIAAQGGRHCPSCSTAVDTAAVVHFPWDVLAAGWPAYHLASPNVWG